MAYLVYYVYLVGLPYVVCLALPDFFGRRPRLLTQINVKQNLVIFTQIFLELKWVILPKTALG